ncbi:hypothetical protein AGMMS49573_09440 [Endomicrobiia bacterium]|nr:hypothetical protein AGMMS49573_09440 [Endomicrobiia bacterium]
MATLTGDVLEAVLTKYSENVAETQKRKVPLLANLKKRGKIREITGATSITEEISAGGNLPIEQSPDAVLPFTNPVTITNVLTHAKYGFAWTIGGNGITYAEEQYNVASPQKLYNIMEERSKSDVALMEIKMNQSFWSLAEGADGFISVPMLVSDTPTEGTIGGIARSNVFWQNQAFDCKTHLGIAAGDDLTPQGLVTCMNDMWDTCCEYGGGEAPTSIYASPAAYSLYRNWFYDHFRQLSNDRKADAAFDTLEFNGVTVYREPFLRVAGTRTKDHIYFLNENYIKWNILNGHNFKFMREREPFERMLKIRHLVTWSNLSTNNMQKQGVIFY